MTLAAEKKHARTVLEHGVPERRYRPELHGVRGLALLGVVLFHLFGNGRVSGGIDIFLTVSGFLFTGMLLREATASGGSIDPLKYYGRLIRRIVVPAAVVVAATLLLGLLISPETKHRQLWTEARASLLYFENFELIKSQLAYGAAGPETSPFQHFWSLSVQGQFYIVWPALAIISVLVAKRLRKPAAHIMGLLAGLILISSLVFAIYLGSYAQDEAYLSSLTRAWQLAFGAVLALSASKLRLPRALRGPAGWIGLTLIVSCGFVLDGRQLFPGPWAFWPILGFTLVLLSAGPAGSNNEPTWTAARFLSSKPFTRVGDLAYGLYLWHWPILIFYLEIRNQDSIGIRGGIVILALTVLLAMLMYRFVELPLQRANKRAAKPDNNSNRSTIVVAASSLVIAGLTMSAFIQPAQEIDTAFGDLNPEIYPGAAQYFRSGTVPDADMFPAPQDARDYKQEYTKRDCAQAQGEIPGSDTVTVCPDLNAPKDPAATVVLAGGSHAGHLEEAFRALGRKYDWEVLVVLKHACVFGGEENDQPMCGKWNENFITWLENNDIDLVVTPGTRHINPPDREQIENAAPTWWQRITETDTSLLLTRGTPRKGADVPECLAEGGTPQECGPSKQEFLEPNPLTQVDLPDKAYTIDITEYVCPKINDPSAKNCDAVVGNILGWFDGGHFTTPFSQSLAPAIEAEMQDVVPQLLR